MEDFEILIQHSCSYVYIYNFDVCLINNKTYLIFLKTNNMDTLERNSQYTAASSFELHTVHIKRIVFNFILSASLHLCTFSSV